MGTTHLCLLLKGSALAALAGLSLVGCSSMATDKATEKNATGASAAGYVMDNQSRVVRTGNNECLHTMEWKPGIATEQCEPQLVAKQTAAELPPPATAAAVPPVQTQRVTEKIYIGADTFFEFDEATLRPNAESALNSVVERALSAQDVSVRITGYTDQIGPEEYNQQLSQQRAQAVRSYLLEKNVPEGSIEVEARGEADPVVTCQGRQGSELIECLQPNRRTEIEFSALEEVEQEIAQ